MSLIKPIAFFHQKLELIRIDADATAFISASGITDETQKTAINTLTLALKDGDVWDSLLAIYPFVGGSASTHKWNLKNPADTDAAFRLTFTGGWTHDSNGAKANGTNAWANTFFVPSTHLSSADSTHLSGLYNEEITEVNVNSIMMGSFNSFTSRMALVFNTGSLESGNLGAVIAAGTQTSRIGYVLSTKTSSTVTTVYKNGTEVATGNSGGTRPSGAIVLASIRLANGTVWTGGYDRNRFGFVTIGTALDSTKVTNLTNAVLQFNEDIGRGI